MAPGDQQEEDCHCRRAITSFHVQDAKAVGQEPQHREGTTRKGGMEFWSCQKTSPQYSFMMKWPDVASRKDF
ncbi:hypothetical protein llap_7736 [Limosa lapponica baueri]|uniref:Uncharacterized protein n=1 Tax=Limosa lapponica baueri TaxID=1758121 RepID=A0A2I0U7D3_LIMLA|nr:hypothetical protein llap_7736 [Limosa lapponica baueri]